LHRRDSLAAVVRRSGLFKKALNVMQLTSLWSAILSAVIFNTLIIVPLLLLAVRGVKAPAESAARLSHRVLLGVGAGKPRLRGEGRAM
jgi:high-affinity K+ transport system ATPase subunit B